MFKAKPLDRQEITLEGHGAFSEQRLADGLIMASSFTRRAKALPNHDHDAEGGRRNDDQRRFTRRRPTSFSTPHARARANVRGSSSVGVSGPVGPVAAGGGVREAPVSWPKEFARAPVSGGVLTGNSRFKASTGLSAAVKERVRAW